MSHGTVHDNSPKESPGVGIIEIKIHDHPAEVISRKKYHDGSSTYRRTNNPRLLPRYVPFINTDDIRFKVDDEVMWAENKPLEQYYLVPEGDLSDTKDYKKIGVVVNPQEDD